MTKAEDWPEFDEHDVEALAWSQEVVERLLDAADDVDELSATKLEILSEMLRNVHQAVSMIVVSQED